MRLLITRTEPDASQWANDLQQKGHTTFIEPLMDVVYLEPDFKPSHAQDTHPQGLIVTSSHALFAIEKNFQHYTQYRGLPLFAVGETTAEYARSLQDVLHFETIYQGPGTALGLVEKIIDFVDPQGGPLLHLAAEELAVDLTPHLAGYGLTLHKCVVYKTNERAVLTEALKSEILNDAIDAVLLMSPKASRIWARLIAEDPLYAHAQKIPALCLSDKVAAPLKGMDGLTVKVAEAPSRKAFMDLIEMCS